MMTIYDKAVLSTGIALAIVKCNDTQKNYQFVYTNDQTDY
jgi:hypothetical protein